MIKRKILLICIILFFSFIKSYCSDYSSQFIQIPHEYKEIFSLPKRLISGKEKAFPKFDEWVSLKSQISAFVGWNENDSSKPKGWAIEQLGKKNYKFKIYTDLFLRYTNKSLCRIFTLLGTSFSGSPSEWYALGYEISLERKYLFDSKNVLAFEIEECIFLSIISSVFRSIFLTHEQLQDICKSEKITNKVFYKNFIDLYFGCEEFFHHHFMACYVDWFVKKYIKFIPSFPLSNSRETINARFIDKNMPILKKG